MLLESILILKNSNIKSAVNKLCEDKDKELALDPDESLSLESLKAHFGASATGLY